MINKVLVKSTGDMTVDRSQMLVDWIKARDDIRNILMFHKHAPSNRQYMLSYRLSQIGVMNLMQTL